MSIQFTKMQALGNDFVIIDATKTAFDLNPKQIQTLADRRRGIGFDQLLLVETATAADVDFNYRIFNADGSEAEQCGNGARCFAKFVKEKQLSHKSELQIQAKKTRMQLKIRPDGLISASMGSPKFLSADISLDYPYTVVDLGNPHLVLQIAAPLSEQQMTQLGQSLQQHKTFPTGINVGFCQQLSPDNIKLVVFERGAGLTQACGSGACAAVAAGIHSGSLHSNIRVDMPGGDLSVEWQGNNFDVWLTGPAATVFDGSISDIDY